MNITSDFMRWLNAAKPGDSKVYYEGFLIVDRERWNLRANELAVQDRQTLMAVVVSAMTSGAIDLVQRRLGPARFAYIAIKRGAGRVWHGWNFKFTKEKC